MLLVGFCFVLTNFGFCFFFFIILTKTLKISINLRKPFIIRPCSVVFSFSRKKIFSGAE